MRGLRAFGRLLRDESGQALTEQAILLTTLVGIGAVGGLWLVKAHPEMLKALDIAVRSYLFVLSLPFP
jgi:Flp pilus assembly pilin Flp